MTIADLIEEAINWATVIQHRQVCLKTKTNHYYSKQNH